MTKKENKPLNTYDPNTTPGQKRQMQTAVDRCKAPATTHLETSKGGLEQGLAKSSMPDSGPSRKEESLVLRSSSPPQKKQDERLGRPSEVSQILGSQAISQSNIAEQTTSQEDFHPVGPDVCTLGIEDSQRQPLGIATDISQNPSSVEQPPKFKTQFLMAIHESQDLTHSSGMRIAKVDTGSKVNCISHDVVKDLDMILRPYSGPAVHPLGKPVMPMGTVKLEWHIMKRTKTYNSEFLVFDSELSRGFDVLLSEDEIAKIGFYIVNNKVWFLDTEGGKLASLPNLKDCCVER